MQKAFVTQGPKSLNLAQVIAPEPCEGEVALDVRAVGICGSDHHIYLGHHPYATFPVIQGHEFCAVVRRYGPGCEQKVPVGERVVVEPLIRCGRCYACSIGRYNCCENLQIVGLHVPGAFQESLVVPEQLIHPIGDLPAHIATFAEPLSIAVQAVKRGRVVAGDKVLILGAGPIGLALVLACKSVGASVAIADLVDTRLEKARMLGADRTHRSDRDDPQTLRTWSDGGMTAVIDAVAVAPAIQMGIDLIRSAGRFVLVGINGQQLPIPISTIVAKEIDVIGSRNSVRVFPEAIALLQANVEKVSRLIHRSSGIETLPEMMDYSIEYPHLVEKVVVTMEDA